MPTGHRILRAGQSVIRALAHEPLSGEHALILALASRTREIVPQDEFVVTTDGLSVTLSGTDAFSGHTNVLMLVFILRSEVPLHQRLELALHSYGERLEGFLSNAYGAPWPIANAQLHVSVDIETMELWWTQAHSSHRVNMYALSRRELEI
jgi:hypothetical protein